MNGKRSVEYRKKMAQTDKFWKDKGEKCEGERTTEINLTKFGTHTHTHTYDVHLSWHLPWQPATSMSESWARCPGCWPSSVWTASRNSAFAPDPWPWSSPPPSARSWPSSWCRRLVSSPVSPAGPSPGPTPALPAAASWNHPHVFSFLVSPPLFFHYLATEATMTWYKLIFTAPVPFPNEPLTSRLSLFWRVVDHSCVDDPTNVTSCRLLTLFKARWFCRSSSSGVFLFPNSLSIPVYCLSLALCVELVFVSHDYHV